MGNRDQRRKLKRQVNTSRIGWVFLLVLAVTTMSAAAQSLSDRARLVLESTSRQDFPIAVRTGRETTGNVYREGENLQISILASITAYLQVFATSPDGDIVQLFPESATADTRIAARSETRVPPDRSRFALQMGKTAGTDLVTVVVTDRNHPLLSPSDLKRAGNALLVRDPDRLAALLQRLDADTSCKACIQHVPIHTSAPALSSGGFGTASSTDGWRAHLWVRRDPVPADEPIVVRVVSNQNCLVKSVLVGDTSTSPQTALPLKHSPVVEHGRIVHIPSASDTFSIRLLPPHNRAIMHVTLQRSNGENLQVSCPISSTWTASSAPQPPVTGKPHQTAGASGSATPSSTIYPHQPRNDWQGSLA
ncbi:MAG TPA: DUF4384 domain-containing protein, partial [Candidatus Ozemobacteraceae bacterium]|nr:DUF4384 domain-containing protein [Candidatus Ozemobacteraceae bacterium]